ncbi:hypothetical protein [Agromyces larvae]|uniref:Uncharacterized protein n=1 Tax=Agromyces larvae TaxID=2929802 RepID=A0ABY4BWZ2_9MICO|nr:hypothetical protein [Agromyces larvae]UOE43748.1 hypothetical protein MTO99_16490 [Agromyces larvae]
MTITRDGITATLDGTTDLGRVEGQATLDESWAPHVQAELTIALPDEATLEDLDPRSAHRVTIAASATYPGSFIPDRSRSFDLGLRDRVIDHERAEVRLSLASDEALLMDDVLTDDEPDYSATLNQASLRTIVDGMLDRIGASLEPGSADATFYVLEDATNLNPNPSIETNTTGYTAGGCAMTRAAATFGTGAWALQLVGNGTADSFATIGSGLMGMQAGRRYTLAATGRVVTALSGVADTNGRERGLYVAVTAGSTTTYQSAKLANVNGTTDRVSITFDVPAGVTGIILRAYLGRTAGTIQWDDVTLVENRGTVGIDYEESFSGDTADTTDYGYTWTGTPNASTSARIALVDRSPDLLAWQPGTSAWSFLQPLFQSVGLRLFCDEQRKWWLVDGSTFVADGVLQLTMPGNLHTATDTTSRDVEWHDAAVVRYRWRAPDGTQQERIDSYAPPGYTKVRLFELERAYPGPGFAAYAVKRAEGRGRTVDLDALADLTVKPSQVLRVNLPDTPALLGVVRAVVYDLTAGAMRVASRGLTDVPDGSWLVLGFASDETFADLAADTLTILEDITP